MKQFNLFGSDIKFNFDGEAQYKTSFGLILSLIFYIIIGGFMYVIGGDFFRRRNPKSTISSIYKQNYTEIDFADYNFSMKYYIVEPPFIPVKNIEEYLDITFMFYNFFNNSITKMNKCSNFNDNEKIINCIDFSSTQLYGYWETMLHNEIKHISISVKSCDPNSTNNCKTKKEIENFLNKGIFFMLVMNKLSYDPNDYKEGIVINQEHFSFSVDPSNRLIFEMILKKESIISDYGWIMKEYKESSKIGFDHYVSKPNNYDDSILTMFFFNSKSSTIINREYPKIQTFLAELGGILNIFILLFGQLSHQYSLCHFKLNLINSLNEVENEYSKKVKIKDLSKLEKFDLNSKILKNNLSSSFDDIEIAQEKVHKNACQNAESNLSKTYEENNQSNKIIKSNNNSEIKVLKHKHFQSELVNDENFHNKAAFKNLYIDSIKKIDELKILEKKYTSNCCEPFSMICNLKFNFCYCCCDNNTKIKRYENIDKYYLKFFEFHNIMLIESKLNIIHDFLFEESSNTIIENEVKDHYNK